MKQLVPSQEIPILRGISNWQRCFTTSHVICHQKGKSAIQDLSFGLGNRLDNTPRPYLVHIKNTMIQLAVQQVHGALQGRNLPRALNHKKTLEATILFTQRALATSFGAPRRVLRLLAKLARAARDIAT